MPSTPAKNIALILPSLSQAVEISVSVAAESVFQGKNVNLLHMSVGWIEFEEEQFASRLHQTVNFANLDGIIIYGATIHFHSHRRAIRQILDCYPDTPIINIGDILDGIPSVIFDNQPVFVEFVRHLVRDKHCQRIALLNGPKENFDAQQRREAVLQALSELDQPLQAQLDWSGNFDLGSGRSAIQQYFQHHNQAPDAIICANDFLALGAIEELTKRGFRIPEDIKVTGFDDLEYSQSIKVPLTTGRNPIFEMAKTAAETLLNWLHGEVPALVIKQGSSAIYRQSTGEQGEQVSQLALLKEFQRSALSRDSNSDRLSLSREINRLTMAAENIEKIDELLYNVGGRQLYFMQFNKKQQLRCVFHLIDGQLCRREITGAGLNPLDINQLFQQRTAGNTLWVIAPVGLEEHYFGFVVVEVIREEADLPEFVANELSKRLENISLANNSSRLTEQVAKTEKMASLGRLVSGLAHEINTPLGIGLVAATNMADEVRNIKQLIAENKMTKSAFDAFIQNCDESQQMIFDNLKRTADLVASFKKVSVDQQVDERQKIDLAAYLTDVLTSLRPRIKRAQIKVEVQFNEPIEFHTHPGTWAQVVTNLLVNAFIHGFDEPDSNALVILKLIRTGRFVEFSITDNGKGIESSKQRLIFDPFFTTRRNQGGTGLGLNIVYNMVTQKLNGEIDFTSKYFEEHSNHGTCFTIKVPLTDS